MRKIHRANPAARIVVTGCYAQRAPEELAALDGVALVVGNSHQAQIPGLIRERPSAAGVRTDFVPLARLDDDAMSLARGPAKILTGDIFAQTGVNIPLSGGTESSAPDRTRPILKIQDGCNNRCSYCVIPFVRGRSRSLAPGAVIDEVRALVSAGVREIVLSGINLGSYGRDLDAARRAWRCRPPHPRRNRSRATALQLDRAAGRHRGFRRARRVVAPHRAAFSRPAAVGLGPHPARHASLVSQRRTTPSASQLIRRLLPDAAIGADVIVGFPGETDADFRDDGRIHRRAAIHLSPRFLVFGAPRHSRRESRRARSGAGDPRTRPRVARARGAKGSRVPRVAIRPLVARPHAGAQRRPLDRSAHRKLPQGPRSRTPSGQRMARSAGR